MKRKKTSMNLVSGIFVSGIILSGCTKDVTPKLTNEEPGVLRLQISPPEERLTGELAPHPFNIEFDKKVREYEEAESDVVLQMDARAIPFGELDIVAFYEQELKGSDYDFAEIRVTDTEGLIIYRETGLIGYNTIAVDEEQNEWVVPSSTSGVINDDCTITYTTVAFDETAANSFLQRIDYKVTQATIDSYFEVVISADELKLYSSLTEGMASIAQDLAQTIMLDESYLNLHGLDIVFKQESDKTNEGSARVGEILITKEKMVSIDWTNQEESIKALENLINY